MLAKEANTHPPHANPYPQSAIRNSDEHPHDQPNHHRIVHPTLARLFPDPVNYRFNLEDLHDADVRTLLAALWAAPMSLDPTRRIAKQLALLARSLEGKHDWALATGSRLVDRPVYVKTTCFEKFPFPDPTDEQKQRIRELGERLDGHRKRQQAAHPDLTLTDLYNVLEKERGGEALTAKERRVHEQGLVAVLRQIHHDLDAAVAAAYGWPADLPDEAILERLVTLNAARAAEEAAGVVRWLRPEYQAPGEVLAPTQSALIDVPEDAAPAAVADAVPATWPDALPEQARAVAAVLTAASVPVTADDIAARFGRRSASRRARVQDLLETLVLLGQARPVDGERYVGG